MRARICALAMGCVLPMLAPASLAGAPDFVLDYFNLPLVLCAPTETLIELAPVFLEHSQC